jgi:hypothetical protein
MRVTGEAPHRLRWEVGGRPFLAGAKDGASGAQIAVAA